MKRLFKGEAYRPTGYGILRETLQMKLVLCRSFFAAKATKSHEGFLKNLIRLCSVINQKLIWNDYVVFIIIPRSCH
ncbi:MAG: hypothetical protein LBJ00_07545 [Planctomycetaceae bacterium]|nr:hypothetical protein [Planctomycetaceae bacterium]